MKYDMEFIDLAQPFGQAYKNGWCYLCNRKVGKCDHTMACKGCHRMWINCNCKPKKGKKK